MMKRNGVVGHAPMTPFVSSFTHVFGNPDPITIRPSYFQKIRMTNHQKIIISGYQKIF